MQKIIICTMKIVMKSKVKNKYLHGFTLVELIISLSILSVIILGANSFLFYYQRVIKNSELRLMAINFTRETMEGRYWDYDLDDTASWESDTPLPTGNELGAALRDNYGAERKYEITTDGTGRYAIIKTKVKWNY